MRLADQPEKSKPLCKTTDLGRPCFRYDDRRLSPPRERGDDRSPGTGQEKLGEPAITPGYRSIGTMARADDERDLLFALIAFQAGLIDRDALAAALQSWAA